MPAFTMSALALALPRTTSTSSVKAPSAARLAAVNLSRTILVTHTAYWISFFCLSAVARRVPPGPRVPNARGPIVAKRGFAGRRLALHPGRGLVFVGRPVRVFHTLEVKCAACELRVSV